LNGNTANQAINLLQGVVQTIDEISPCLCQGLVSQYPADFQFTNVTFTSVRSNLVPAGHSLHIMFIISI